MGPRKSFDVRKADSSTLLAPELKPVTIVSTDSHVCLPPKDYKAYLDPQYHDAFPDFLEDADRIYKFHELMDYPPGPEALEVFDTRGAVSAAGEVGYFDPVWRLRQVEAEGVAAEFLHPFGMVGFTPFIDMFNSKRSMELRSAGKTAHNRFLADYCSEAPGRLLGVPWINPWPDWETVVRDCTWAREQGFRAIFPPHTVGHPGDLPPVYDPWWDPLWAACQDLELVVHMHAGFNSEQGAAHELLRQAFLRTDTASATGTDGKEEVSLDETKTLTGFNLDSQKQDSILVEFFESFDERRALWQLMWGGVFDRFPRLKVAFIEIHGDWVPGTLAFLDAKHAADPGPLTMKPSEYWARHCAIGNSLMRYGDVAARHGVGVERVMFGTDYPHMESTWPNTQDWIRVTLGSIPEVEARGILGENAIKFYGLDRALLEKTAKRIGPLPGEIFGEHHVDPRIIQHFSFRAGIDKPINLHSERLAEVFEIDRTGALTANGFAAAT